MYLVMQIGCIECGVSSYAIAKTETLEEAEKIRDNHPSTWDTEGGDGYVMIINIDTLKEEEETE